MGLVLAAAALVAVVGVVWLVTSGEDHSSEEVLPAGRDGDPCGTSFPWQQAGNHIGELVTIAGGGQRRIRPWVLRATDVPNVGNPYPDRRRVTVVICVEDRYRFVFPEVTYDGERVCVTGVVETYQGAAQILIDAPTDTRTVT